MKYLFGLSLLLFFASVNAQPNIALTPVLTGSDRPVFASHCGDDRLFVIEQDGKILVKQPGSAANTYTTFLDITGPVNSSGNEQGLLGLAFHPDYKNNGYFYVNYTTSGGGASGHSVLARFSVDPADSNVALVASQVVLDTINDPYSNHNGGCLQFGPDGYLYMGIGDGGSGNDPGNRAQNKALKLGKMLRYDVNNPNPPYYFVPPTNPFVDSVGVRPEIWAYGLRNPWRFSFDRITGDFWIGDVGQGTREEIDLEPLGTPGGRNYGWRCYEGSIPTPGVSTTGCPSFANTTPPIFDYLHSGGDCSLTGGYLYRGAQIGGLYGRYLYADYCSGKMRMLENVGGTWTQIDLMDVAGFEVSSFGEDRWGEVYVCFLSGTVYKITSPDCEPTSVVLSDSVRVVCPGANVELSALEGENFTYQWYQNGNALVGDTTFEVSLTDTGSYTVVAINDLGCSTTSSVIHVVDPSAPVSIDISPIANVCHNDAAFNLQATPTGGTFSGAVDSTGFFDPTTATFGTQTVYYTYVDSMACNAVVTDTTTFEFIAPADIQITVPYGGDSSIICILDDAGTFPVFNATPIGGEFTTNNGNFSGLGNTLVADSVGTFIINYIYTDSNNCITTETVTVLGVLCLDVEQLKQTSFNVYPNPTEDELLINVTPSTKPLTLDVMNCTGQIVMQNKLPVNTTSHSVSLKHLTDGVYILRLHNEDGTAYAKAIKTSTR